MELSESEKRLADNAVKFVKKNKRLLQEMFASSAVFTERSEPVTVFMAGIPGAGKTEISKHVIEKMSVKAVRIDADDIRELFREIGYDGTNAYIFQAAASHGVDKLFDYVQRKKYHAIVDGTFAHSRAVENVERALGRGRKVIIYFIYQDPTIAWKITKGREKEMGRRVPKEAFINAYFQSRRNVAKIKEKFGNDVELNLIIKNAQTHLQKQYNNIESIDAYLDASYTRDMLEKMLW